MSFLNHILLWALPATLLPILIHLLNRLRYRSVNWAAVMFLISATRSSTRHARVRQYLILLFRVLLILTFLLALARPVVGGWLGLTMAGAPDTILVLLDRSASMEGTDPRRQTSKRTHALSLIEQAAKEIDGSSRFVLVENVLCTPQEIAGASVLKELALTGATDTSADIPAMIRTALDYMIQNQSGRTEIWLASDFQKSNWRPNSHEWQNLTTQIGSLPQDIRVRILDLQESYNRNTSISLSTANRRRAARRNQLDLTMDLERCAADPNVFPMILTLDGTRSQVDLSMKTQRFRYNQAIALSTDRPLGGWGKAELPADENPRDNVCYFAYGEDLPLKAAVVTDDIQAGRALRLAIAPAPDVLNTSCDVVSSDDWSDAMLQDLALLVWQAPNPTAQRAAAIASFVESGGTLVCFPAGLTPATTNAPENAEKDSFFGIRWTKTESADKKTPFRVANWEEYDGPLARTADGENLPLGNLAFSRRQRQHWKTAGGSPWHTLASYADGQAFLLRTSAGRGNVYICTSLPRDDWSNLSNGTVIVPMLQRLLASGASRLTLTETGLCGEWRSPDSQMLWKSLDSETDKDYRWHAGVYRSGKSRVALNIPVKELAPDTLNAQAVEALFGNLSVQILDKLGHRKTDKLQSEIWHMFVYAALLCMIIESSLLLQERTGRAKKEKLDA